jgi:hypothetical protein
MPNYFHDQSFDRHHNDIMKLVELLPRVDSPPGWEIKEARAVSGLECFGFSEDDFLLIVSSDQISVMDLATAEIVYREKQVFNSPLYDFGSLTHQGVGPLAGRVIPVCGLDGGGLPQSTFAGESLALVSSHYPASYVVYNPPYTDFLSSGAEGGSVIFYHGLVSHCGFSWTRNYMIVVDTDITIWGKVAK